MSLADNSIQSAPLQTTTALRLRILFSLLAALLAGAVLLQFSVSLLADPDTYWHLKTGLDIVASGALPSVDNYSYTFAGHPWVSKEWLAQVAFALAYEQWSWAGLAALATLSIATTAGLASWFLSAHLKPIAAILVASAATFMIFPIFSVRPHILTMPILLTWTFCLFEAAREKRAPPLWLLALICLWANLHATVSLGLGLAGFAGLQYLAVAGRSEPRVLAQWIAFGALSVAAAAINPNGFQAIYAATSVASGNEAVPMITEWQAFDAAQMPLQTLALLAGLFWLLVARPKIDWATGLFIVFMLYLFLEHMRFMYVLLLLAPALLARPAAARHPAISLHAWTRQRPDQLEAALSRNFPLAATALLLALALTFAAFAVRRQVEPDESVYPRTALAYAQANGLTGNVFNAYNFGGPLVLNGVKTFIDGRTDVLFLGGFSAAYDQMGLPAGLPALEKAIKTYSIDWAILPVDDEIATQFDRLQGWTRVFKDEYAVIYKRS